MDTVELRIALTEEIVRELLWRALQPDGIVLTGSLNDAIAEQQELLGVALDGYALTGISTTVEAGTMYAELSYTPVQGTSDQQSRSRLSA